MSRCLKPPLIPGLIQELKSSYEKLMDIMDHKVLCRSCLPSPLYALSFIFLFFSLVLNTNLIYLFTACFFLLECMLQRLKICDFVHCLVPFLHAAGKTESFPVAHTEVGEALTNNFFHQISFSYIPIA